MNKILMICVLIVSVIFISGCTSNEQTNSNISTSSQSDQGSDTQNPELIIKQSDVSGLTLDQNYYFYAVQKDTIYEYGNENGRIKYTDTPGIDYRNVGENSRWSDRSGRWVDVELFKYDSNSGLMEIIFKIKDNYETMSEEEMNIAEEKGIEFVFGDPNIGEYSYYVTTTDINTDIEATLITFMYKNNLVMIRLVDERDNSFNEAIRIAELVISRLD